MQAIAVEKNNTINKEKKKLYVMADVDMRITPSTRIPNGVRTLGLEWGVIKQWTKTRLNIGPVMICGELNG